MLERILNNIEEEYEEWAFNWIWYYFYLKLALKNLKI